MRAVDVVSLTDPTASVFEQNGLFAVRGIFPNGTGENGPVRKWGTGFFPSQDGAWNAAVIQLDAVNSGRFN